MLSDEKEEAVLRPIWTCGVRRRQWYGGNPFAGDNGKVRSLGRTLPAAKTLWATSIFPIPLRSLSNSLAVVWPRAQRRPRYSLHIDFFEAIRGVTKEVTIEGKTHHQSARWGKRWHPASI